VASGARDGGLALKVLERHPATRERWGIPRPERDQGASVTVNVQQVRAELEAWPLAKLLAALDAMRAGEGSARVREGEDGEPRLLPPGDGGEGGQPGG